MEECSQISTHNLGYQARCWRGKTDMTDTRETDSSQASKAATKRKPYAKPDFRHEKVFETMALSCGKVQSTQGQCASNRKNS